ncbi:MAG: sulfatase-like hydrolase/transferase [Acidobacteriota bacterium]|nr:sulfatase-like hydrolase/transferase [Acidobacteriota bacterium]
MAGSLYLLLVNVAFADQWLVRSPIFNWIPTVVHAFLPAYAVGVGLVAWRLYPSGRGKPTPLLAFLLAQLAFVTALGWAKVITAPVPGTASLAWSFGFLAFGIWAAVLDTNWSPATCVEATEPLGFSLRAAWLASLFVSACYFMIGPGRRLLVADPEELWGMLLLFLLGTIGYLTVFLIFLGLLAGSSDLARRFAGSRARLVAFHLGLACLFAILLRQIVLPTLLFTGWVAALYAVALAFTVSFSLAATRTRLASARTLRPAKRTPFMVFALCGMAIAAVAYLCTRAVPVFDWNFLLQRTSAFVVWGAVFYLCNRVLAPDRLSARTAVALVAVGVLGLQAFASVTRSWPSRSIAVTAYLNQAVERYLKEDVSFHALRDFARGSRFNVSNADFYRFLAQNTNVPRTIAIRPPETLLVDELRPTAAPRPYIFLFVIDSLRPDYLSPYNPQVHFTPAIDSFARESIVFQRAFTRYAGTALSEPSIWTGTMQFHQEFIRTFAPINALEKLLTVDGYESWVAVDLVMSVVKDPQFKVKDLNKAGEDWDGLDLCTSLSRVRAGLEERPVGAAPVFVYVQAQNTHQVSIERRQIVPKHDYPGFESRAASEVEKIDGCFGSFIQYLKARGLYDSSIVMFTSDHGDEFWEHGNFGHVASLFPEVVRVPLVVHLPPPMQRQVVSEPASAAFLTDITPSLYYLLGHRSLKKNPLFGRSLFATAAEELHRSEWPYYMIASSYSPIYGVVDRDGKMLFVADGLNYENQLFDLEHDPGARENIITFNAERTYQEFLRQQIREIASFYGYSGPPMPAQTGSARK